MKLKKPKNYNKAVEMAKSKEWKAQRMTQLGMGIPLVRLELRTWESVPAVTREIVPT